MADTGLVDDLCFRPLSEVAQLILTRDLSPVDVVTAVLDRCERIGNSLNCFITVLPELALKRARSLEELLMHGAHLGPLHGIPISLKDNIATAGIPATGGSPILENWIPEHDATAAARLLASGAVLFAKTNLYEFAYGAPHPRYGPARNPWNVEYESGGSSSGSASSIGAGLGYASVGTDTGGSVRVPASFCGAVGMKATYGRVSRAGVIPLSYNLDAVGPITRTVRDAAIILQSLSGYDPADSTTVTLPVPDFASRIELGVRGLRLGVPSDTLLDFCHSDVKAAFVAACGVLQAEGATMVEVSLPNLHKAQMVVDVIVGAEATEYHRQYLSTQAHQYHPSVRLRLERGAFIPATEYVHAQRIRQQMIEQLRITFRGIDALLLPAHPTGSYPVGARSVLIGEAEIDIAVLNSRYTRLFNLTGEPAIVLPCGFTPQGLPIGLQVIGRPFDEETMFQVARAYEHATEWHLRRPTDPPRKTNRGPVDLLSS